MQRLQLAEGVPEGLEVWRLALDLNAPVADEDDRLLSRAEWQRAQRLHRHADIVRAVATRAALRRLLSAHTGIAPEKLAFTQNAYGKPALENAGGPAFNVSHSGHVALIAIVPGGAVGVDIERCRSEAELAPLQGLVLSPSEQLDHALPFMERWVVKEAVLKALGLGIADHLRSLSITSSLGPPDTYHLEHSLPVSSPLQAWPLPAPSGYAAALGYIDSGYSHANAQGKRYSTNF
ncbi:4'-phosphopantetheinyl transferase superfamily protein [Halomonas sp. FeN2]|uniref:4'-phosphopantetheinyl transferase superfamily protein n=1 Tax=Vreelandella neptunia TaxID=115551 RepID=A0ABZ0YR17_9GAMM|nr:MULTISPECIES: 4'-phosphopantetheinyl transferase superfamily protein [Halomonas]TDV92714.1 4'-phosphopantetheinyl transferase [Halomonas alkaliantarctica]MBF56518.1 4-phosphopantetheinyl transferase [Halomonas sp.]MDN3558760.1 4'-phosphopantetheinyl transferase superfamily protein [Halomonas neptunia]UBR48900.1 4'-phosphopantetheinyl transferase superfamily protein [Halomonas sp. FeN2]WQH13727.1 4'-phosphopantetheinyl transferase superfamily protein [Halomonas neptunia]|tara:strand:- start:192 stop:896 length:705 start_codon:yes stop_codon:yes gene_type:complete